MATIPAKPELDVRTPLRAASLPAWTPGTDSPAADLSSRGGHEGSRSGDGSFDPDTDEPKVTRLDALQALIAFAALHEQLRRRKAFAAQRRAFDAGAPAAEFETDELFVLDEVLQLVAERAVAITGADGLAIALAENNEIVLRAATGKICPDVGARIDRDSAFSGASFRTAQTVMCDDTETDSRVNLQACRRLGARSMVAVPLCGRQRVIGLLEAFSSWPFGFNDSDVRNLSLLAELVVSALKPEDEDRFAQSAEVAATKLSPTKPEETPLPVVAATTSVIAPVIAPPAPVAKTETQALVPVVEKKPDEKKSVEEKPKPKTQSTSNLTQKPAEAKPAVAAASTTPAAATSAVASSSVTSPSVTTPAIASTTVSGVPPTADSKSEPAAPASATANSASTPLIPLWPAGDASDISESKTDLPLAAADASELSLWQEPENPPRRTAVLIVLAGIIVVAAFAVGVWWKWKSLQSAQLVVQTEPSAKSAETGTAPSANSSSNIATNTNPAAAANAASDKALDAAGASNAPASADDLAKFPRVTGVRHWSSADSSTVVLDLEDQVQYEAHRLAGPDRIYFDLHDTQLAPELTGKSIEIGDTLLNRVRVAQPVAGMTRVVLETRDNPNFSVSLEPNPYRLVVEVRKVGTTSKGAVNLFPNAQAEKSRQAIVIPPPTKEDLQLRAHVPKMRIVVDAGHGGWDLGTVGRRGLLEKDLVLEIAERLGKLLESRLGSDVILTRSDDNYIPLDERAQIANQSQADLFISVHANYSDLPSARGVETYYTNIFTPPGSKEAGAKEVGGTDGHAVDAKASGPTLSPADLHDRVEQSRKLAASVQRSLYGALAIENPGLRDRGIKEAGFVVLTESAMPGILAEVSFVSSPTDEQKLRSDGYREQIAEALYKGIARYAAANSKGVKVASAGK
jgi:N-acetylmuramoyl-L-alanine amidase/putative methionine-R-sulfoxide reductase with GAF domain